MTAPRLPTVRLPAFSGGEPVLQEPVSLEQSAPLNRLIVSELRPAPASMHHPSLTSSETEVYSQTSETDSGNDDLDNISSELTEEPSPISRPPLPPRFSRTLSMPLPARLTALQNPYRPGPSSFRSSSRVPTTRAAIRERAPQTPQSPVHELSVELADSVQMVIQTMLQISPAQVLDPAREQFSACSLSVPTPSMSAMFTAMKNLNYISANMAAFSTAASPQTSPTAKSFPDVPPISSQKHEDFDIGEMLQSVGDSLSGAASQIGVDLVLYHGDVGLKHVFVNGDEGGLSYTFSHIVRQVLNTTEQGDSIELGLLVEAAQTTPPISDVLSPQEESMSGSPVELEGPLRCTVRISHKFGSRTPDNQQYALGESSPTSESDLEPPPSTFRPEPSFQTLLLRRLLRQIGATFTANLPPPSTFENGRSCELTVILERGNTPVHTPYTENPSEDSQEPTLDQLASFSETLRGKRVTLYASAKGSFAQHLTSYLTAWGMDVSHISPDGNADGGVDPKSLEPTAPAPDSTSTSPLSTYGGNTEPVSSIGIPSKIESRQAGAGGLSFVVIDDDVEILRERLYILHTELQSQHQAQSRKRPSLSGHHRKSSPQISRLIGGGGTQAPFSNRSASPVVIIHFTSLSKFKLAKDAIQSVMVTYAASTTPIPEVMIIPKPAGPRRFLTALHTAVTKPYVDPFFIPIATSPTSPGIQNHGSFFQSYDSSHLSNSHPSHSVASNRPPGSRSNSDRSTRSNKGENRDNNIEHVAHPPPASPLGLPDNVEYFSEAAVRLGSSPSSGLVIQSPDGQPAGIFFHPRGKTSRNSSSQSMEKEWNSQNFNQNRLLIPQNSRRGSSARPPSNPSGEAVTFSSLHESVSAGSRSPPHLRLENLPSPSLGPRPSRKQSSPRSETPSTTSQQPTNMSRRPTGDGTRMSSPTLSPTEGGGTSRRVLGKRPAYDIAAASASANKKGKGANDGTIVPPISVLIVDDNVINQTILSTFMRKKKIKYDIANNGLEAVQKWRTGGFHLILMDIQMPVMDGIEATKEIRRIEKSNAGAGYPPLTPSEGVHTPPVRTPSDTSEPRSTSSPYRSSVIIVALTASSLQSDRVAALAAGCNDFLTKPVSLLWLNNKIIEWGSIKALQMWADLRPEAARNLSNGQAAQARNVAERLHVPKGRGTPSPSRPRTAEDSSKTPSSALGSSSGVIWTPSSPNMPWDSSAVATSLSRSNSSGARLSTLPSSSKADNGMAQEESVMMDTSIPDAYDVRSPTAVSNISIVDSPSKSLTPTGTNLAPQHIKAIPYSEPVKIHENGLKNDVRLNPTLFDPASSEEASPP